MQKILFQSEKWIQKRAKKNMVVCSVCGGPQAALPARQFLLEVDPPDGKRPWYSSCSSKALTLPTKLISRMTLGARRVLRRGARDRETSGLTRLSDEGRSGTKRFSFSSWKSKSKDKSSERLRASSVGASLGSPAKTEVGSGDVIRYVVVLEANIVGNDCGVDNVMAIIRVYRAMVISSKIVQRVHETREDGSRIPQNDARFLKPLSRCQRL